MTNPLGYSVMYGLQGGLCFYCSRPMADGPYRFRRNPHGWTKDHVVAKRNGGKGLDNTVLACARCNTEKAHSYPSLLDIHLARILWVVFADEMGMSKNPSVVRARTRRRKYGGLRLAAAYAVLAIRRET